MGAVGGLVPFRHRSRLLFSCYFGARLPVINFFSFFQAPTSRGVARNGLGELIHGYIRVLKACIFCSEDLQSDPHPRTLKAATDGRPVWQCSTTNTTIFKPRNRAIRNFESAMLAFLCVNSASRLAQESPMHNLRYTYYDVRP